MIERRNYLDIVAYLDYLVDIRQVQENTRGNAKSRLVPLLLWADSRPFSEFNKIKPTFQKYLESRTNNDGEPLSASYLSAVFKVCRAFLFWAKREWPIRYKNIDHNAIEALRPSRVRSEEATLKKREIYTLDDMLRIISIKPDTLAEKRLIAGTAFLFLSGMRITAFLSMPIKAFNIDEWSVSQLPELGVKTKNSKASITYLLNIPELRRVVSEWDSLVRGSIPDTANWYAVLGTDVYFTGERRDVKYSHVEFRKHLKAFFVKHGLSYLSPHKFRHGHAVYALKKAKDMETWKAISQNLMHSNTGITDGIYGQLVSEDQKRIIHDL